MIYKISFDIIQNTTCLVRKSNNKDENDSLSDELITGLSNGVKMQQKLATAVNIIR
ncbi:MAG: hypothetical protein V1709_11265 [Planctomycetota bacterium]